MKISKVKRGISELASKHATETGHTVTFNANTASCAICDWGAYVDPKTGIVEQLGCNVVESQESVIQAMLARAWQALGF